MHLDAPTVSGWLAATALAYKPFTDFLKARQEGRTSAATANKNDAEAGATALKSTSEALAASNLSATQWMKKYEDVLVRIGELSGQLNAQQGEIIDMRGQIRELRDQKDGAEAAQKRSESEKKDLQRQLTTEKSDHEKTKRLLVDVQSERDEYKAGYDAAMTLFDATNDKPCDRATLEDAEATIKRVAEFEVRQMHSGQKPAGRK